MYPWKIYKNETKLINYLLSCNIIEKKIQLHQQKSTGANLKNIVNSTHNQRILHEQYSIYAGF